MFGKPVATLVILQKTRPWRLFKWKMKIHLKNNFHRQYFRGELSSRQRPLTLNTADLLLQSLAHFE